MEKKLNLEKNWGWQITVPPYVVVVKLLSRVQLFAAPMTIACQVFLCFTISQSLLRFMSTESLMLSNHLILCHQTRTQMMTVKGSLLHSIFPSIRIFPTESALPIRWPKYWSFQFRSPQSPHQKQVTLCRVVLTISTPTTIVYKPLSVLD